MGNRHDKSEVPTLEGLERAFATTEPKVGRTVARPPPPDGHKKWASAPLLWPSIGPVAAHGESSRFRASPAHASQWLFGDWGVRAGARESLGRPPGRLPPGAVAVPLPLGPPRGSAWAQGGVWACPRLPAGRILGGSKDE